MGTIRAVCVSSEKGTAKRRVEEGLLLEDYGLEGDAHAGKWHRQVSLLPWEAIREFQKKIPVEEGAFGENLVTEGLDFKDLTVGTVLCCGEAELEMTQIGKECHKSCAIRQATGDCIMPGNGVFARVLKGGSVRPKDSVEPVGYNRRYRAAVLTASDRGAAGVRADLSGPLVRELVEKDVYLVVEQVLVPDDREEIVRELIRLCDRTGVDLILTTGGTGLSPRDVTPEATMEVGERVVPGISEAMRSYSLTITRRAMLSRGVSVIRGKTLIINLPGSPKAVRESLAYLLPALSHGLEILTGSEKGAVSCGDEK